ncbi:MAG: hypothetical protein AAF546_04520 [Verrucomicrobiota bacterium]
MSDPPICPYLPKPEVQMTHACLTELRGAEAHTFYFKALQYGHYLWQKRHAGRAILAITRALYADVPENESILKQWPLPYAALKWIVSKHASDDFPGNPRISFQHQATRLKGERREIRRARAWAAWAIIRVARPSLEADLSQDFIEPTHVEIRGELLKYGLEGEAALWESLVQR